ncbi:hypothetical protein AB0I51_03275 [Streptomyces sp. NPDC050549]|uniref:hypothetical protein n=1 Tax=Streptomyces sp. NPDC050549 TaxID=3155406 RepID=UPI0034382F33
MTSLSRFQDRRFNGYLGVRLPHALDAEVDVFVTAYMSSPKPLDMGPRAAGVLSAYGRRMASVAVRTRSAEPLRRGLVAVGLAEAWLEDPRNNLYGLAALHDGASLIGTPFSGLITEVSRCLPPSGLAALRDFDGRQERAKSIEVMGIRRTGEGETFLYR